MSDLVEFLKARLKEDETAAKAAGGARWEVGLPNRRIVVAPWEPGDRWSQPEYVAAFVAQDPLADGCRDHIARHDAARVLREVAAKRRIIEAHGLECRRLERARLAASDEVLALEAVSYGHGKRLLESLLRDLASAYSDHPDYQEAWRA